MSSFLHSAAWERLQVREGHQNLRFEDQLYTKHQLPFGHYYTGYRLSLGTLPTFASKPVFARIEPLDHASLKKLEKDTNSQLKPTFAIQPRQTSLVDLTLSSEELLANFNPKFRYNLHLAERQGVEVSIHQEDALQQLPRFQTLLTQTTTRQGFRSHQANHYRLLVEELSKDSMVRVVIAQKDGVDLAALLLIMYENTATYLHGASSDQQKTLKAPNLLHWQTMLHAKANGCTTYDLWGTHATKEGNTWKPIEGHPSAGVTRFKLGLGGEIVDYPGSYDLVFQPFWYSAYTTLRGLRSTKRAFS